MDAEGVTMEGVELLGISMGDLEISSFAVEPVPASQNQVNRRLDDVFTVILCYQDNWFPNERWLAFTLPIEIEDGFDVLPDVARELDSLHANPNVYYRIASLVAKNCDLLRQEVLYSGRTSLAMVVKIRVGGFRLTVHYELEPEYDHMYDDGIHYEEEAETKKFLSSEGGVRFVSGDQISSTSMECCSICLEEFQKHEKNNGEIKHDRVAVLPCSHVFHEDCLVPWIAMGKKTCPFCRFNLLPC